MNELLDFVRSELSFLYNVYRCRFVNSSARGSDALLVFEADELRLRLTIDRGQITIEFQNAQTGDDLNWYSIGMIRQMLTNETCDNEVLDSELSQFICDNFVRIMSCFSTANAPSTEKQLAILEEQRGIRLFGN